MEKPKTQAQARLEEFKKRGEAARILAESALADIDIALEENGITQEQADFAAYEVTKVLGRVAAWPEPAGVPVYDRDDPLTPLCFIADPNQTSLFD